MRVGGKDVEGSFVVSGPAVVAEQLPDSHPSKAVRSTSCQVRKAAYGANTRNQFAGHAYDAQIVLEKVLPVALKKAKPGTPEFRAALRDAMETMGRTIFSHGVMNWTRPTTGATRNETGVMLKVSGRQVRGREKWPPPASGTPQAGRPEEARHGLHDRQHPGWTA
jgi:branched-chain amino acid transport system substrate-binding protein